MLDNSLSFEEKNLDLNGCILEHDGRLLRGIYKKNAGVYKELLSSELSIQLFNTGLVKTRLTELTDERFEYILEHERVPFVSYITEWSGNMLKDAALVTLDLSLILYKNNLQLQDAHPWNILFDGCKPIFIDFTSIIPRRYGSRWFPLREFNGKFLFPLLLMSYGCPNEARNLVIDWKTLRGRNITKIDVFSVLLKRKKFIELIRFIIPKLDFFLKGEKKIKQIEKRVKNIGIPLKKTRWSEYCEEEVNLDGMNDWNQKRLSVYKSLKICKPKTVLDIGCNTGWFSKMAAILGANVIAFDIDETTINKMYSNEEVKKLNILPLVMDFRYPTKQYGYNLRCISAEKRFKCEMVLALAIVHHLVFSQKMHFSQIVELLSAYSSKQLLVEFIPKEDIHVNKMYNEKFYWYNLDNFLQELKNHYSKIEILPSTPDPRVFLLCYR